MANSASTTPNHDALYQIAEQQAGYFTTRQAASAGFTRPLLAYHVRQGQFQRVKHGVYGLARFPEMPHADLFIALLEVGPQAVISHESALGVYDLSDVLPGVIHITVPRTASRRHSGMRLHMSRLEPDEVAQGGGLRVTTIPRTIADLITGHRPGALISQAIAEAVQRGLVTRQALVEFGVSRGGRIEQVIRDAFEKEPVQ